MEEPMGQGGEQRRGEFQKAVGDAAPLEGRDQVRPPPKTLRRRRRVDGETAGFEVDRLGERVEGIAPGIDRDLLRRLRNREFPPDARVDLHGLDVASARRRVRESVGRAHGDGERCVLVIHGRGRHSESEPILKEALLDWLAEAPLASQVMAFCSATGGDGGVGATYLLLRRER
jgi:DNA-nicking Smr family endonuclease